MDRFEENLKLLRQADPALANRVSGVPFPENILVVHARDGSPVPKLRQITLHSAYHPVKEAARTVSQFERPEGYQTVVYGLGFGYHVLALLRTQPGIITVIEPLMPMFRAFLSHADLSLYLPRVRFIIGESGTKIIARHQGLSWNVFEHRPSLQLAETYFDELERGRELLEFLGRSRLRILVVPPIYGGSLPTARYCARALENLGHHVSLVECERFEEGFFALRQTSRNKAHTEVLNNKFMDLMGQVVAARAAEFQPDLVLALAQAPLSPKTIASLKSLRVPVAFWFVEDFRTLPYWKDVAGHYDHFFPIQRGEFFEKLRAAGCPDAYYLPQACSLETHRPLRLSPEELGAYSADLSFMGAGYYNRKMAFPRLLDFDFKIWGTGWELESILGPHIQNGSQHVPTEEAVKIYNAGRINLNLHSSNWHNGVNPEGDFVNPRTFEIAACGGFQLVDERSELQELFVADKEIVTFGTLDELRDRVAYYLEHEEERHRISALARARVFAEHTMEHRMNEMLLHIYLHRLEELEVRLHGRKSELDIAIEQAGPETELGQFLGQFRDTPDFSFKKIIQHIESGKGALSETETLLLTLNQVIKEGK